MTDDRRDAPRRPLRSTETLREGTFNGVWSRLTATIGEDHNLVISGHDIGPRASLIGGEMEFWIKVENKHLPALHRHLSGLLGIRPSEGSTIPGLLKIGFDRGEFTSGGGLTEWMRRKGVPSSFSSWP